MSRFMHDLADAWEWHERWADFKEAERIRWKKAQPVEIKGGFTIDLTDQDRKEIQQQIAAGLIPF